MQAEQDRAVVIEETSSQGEAFRSITPRHLNLNDASLLAVFDMVAVYTAKELIPKFSGDTPAAQLLRRNRETGRWIRQFENLSSDTFAKKCQGIL